MKQQLLLLSVLAFTAISQAQNVGVGTENPAEKLEVNGNIRISANAARSIAVSDAAVTGISGNDLSISAGSSKFSGNYTVGGNLLLAGGRGNSAGGQAGGNIILTTGINFYAPLSGNPAARNGDIIFKGGVNTGMGNNNSITEFARMDGTTGNWGFGTTTPTTRLDVVGTVKTTGLQLTTGAAAGFVLTSNASGVASWANAASLAISETDPKVGANTTNYLSKWNGTALVSAAVFESGGNVGLGTASPSNKLSVNGNMNVTGSLGVATSTPVAKLDVNGNFKLGASGSVINNIIKFYADFGSVGVPANNTFVVTVSPIAGAVVGSTVSASPSLPLPPGVSIGFCRVVSDTVVELFFVNGSNALQNTPPMRFFFTVIN